MNNLGIYSPRIPWAIRTKFSGLMSGALLVLSTQFGKQATACRQQYREDIFRLRYRQPQLFRQPRLKRYFERRVSHYRYFGGIQIYLAQHMP